MIKSSLFFPITVIAKVFKLLPHVNFFLIFGKALMVPLQIILTHQGVRKYLLAKCPKLLELRSLLNHHLLKLRYLNNNDVHPQMELA